MPHIPIGWDIGRQSYLFGYFLPAQILINFGGAYETIGTGKTSLWCG